MEKITAFKTEDLQSQRQTKVQGRQRDLTKEIEGVTETQFLRSLQDERLAFQGLILGK